MGTIVELKYSNANNYISKLNQIDDKLELAYKQIAESTDFGSTAMQATWSFGSKKAIFNTLSDSKKIIKKIRQADKDLSKIISNLDDDYEKVAKKSKKQIETERWLTNHFSWVIPKKIYPSVIINPFITSFIVPGFIISPFQQIIQSIINPDFIPGNGSSDTGNNEGNTSNGNSANGNNSNGNTSNNNNSNGQTSSTTIPSTGRVDINNNYSIPDTQWSEITPHKTNAEGQRSPNAYNEVLAELDVANRKRYAPTDKSTWCNIYVWDATKAMGCEIPHYYDPNTGAPLTRDYCIKKTGPYLEMSATRMRSWLGTHGSKYGWVECDEATAIAMANKGMPTVVTATTTNHVGMVVPQNQGESGVMISQAGKRNFEHGPIRNGFGNYPVKYYYHV